MSALLLALGGDGGSRCGTLSRVRSIVLNSFTGPGGLELSEVADPMPADGEQLVRVRAASLGPWDRSSVVGAFAAMGGSTDFP